jgi:hypothetical protein
MGHTEAVDLLQQTLDEEKAADEKLSALTADDVPPGTASQDETAYGRPSRSKRAARRLGGRVASRLLK